MKRSRIAPPHPHPSPDGVQSGVPVGRGVPIKVSPSLPTHYVQHQASLEALIESLTTATVFGFDTEFVGEHNYEPQLCLLQVATEEGVWLVDPLAGIGLDRFWELITHPEKEMVLLAAREEIRFCLRYARRPPTRMIDLQVAAALVGFGYPLSHTNLVRKLLSVPLNHRETFTDWRKRPLSTGQLEYAADDVRHLIQMRRMLEAETVALGSHVEHTRWEWVEGECARLIERVVAAETEERWSRLPGASGMSRRELAILREVWRWREDRARHQNIPVRRVLRDEILVEIARRKPTSTADLFALRGMDRAAATGLGAGLVSASQAGLALPDEELPASLRRHDPPQVGLLAQILSLATQQLSARHRVDPAILATSAELQDIVRWRLGSRQAEEPFALTGWRGELLRQPLLDILDGRRLLRVSDPTSDTPLVFEDA